MNPAIQPLSATRLAKMSSGEIDRAEAAITQHICQIAERHYGAVGLELKIDKEPTSYWFLFGVKLRSALIPHTRVLDDGKHLAFLQALFEEIFDFLMFAYDGAPAYAISELSRAFGSGKNAALSCLCFCQPARNPCWQKRTRYSQHSTKMRGLVKIKWVTNKASLQSSGAGHR